MTRKKKHDHTVCEHDIAYCDQCDEAYCVKANCDDKWEKKIESVLTFTGGDGTTTGTYFPRGNEILCNTHSSS